MGYGAQFFYSAEHTHAQPRAFVSSCSTSPIQQQLLNLLEELVIVLYAYAPAPLTGVFQHSSAERFRQSDHLAVRCARVFCWSLLVIYHFLFRYRGIRGVRKSDELKNRRTSRSAQFMQLRVGLVTFATAYCYYGEAALCLRPSGHVPSAIHPSGTRAGQPHGWPQVGWSQGNPGWSRPPWSIAGLQLHAYVRAMLCLDPGVPQARAKTQDVRRVTYTLGLGGREAHNGHDPRTVTLHCGIPAPVILQAAAIT